MSVHQSSPGDCRQPMGMHPLVPCCPDKRGSILQVYSGAAQCTAAILFTLSDQDNTLHSILISYMHLKDNNNDTNLLLTLL